MKSPFVTCKLNQTWPVNVCLPVAKAASACLVMFLLTFGAASRAQAQNYSVVYSFGCGPYERTGPNGDLITDGAGNLYGTTYEGGTGVFGNGVVYELSGSGVETVLHYFGGPPTGPDPLQG